MNFRFLLNSAALGFGLAMDAFSVSLANGLAEPRMGRRRMAGIAGVYALFQFAMPLLGWVFIHTAAQVFGFLNRVIPFVALLLLLYIGGKMLLEGIRAGRHPEEPAPLQTLTRRALLGQGLATSLDALSVGFTIAGDPFPLALAASLIIGGVTFAVCLAGLAIGKKAGTALSHRASILGGLILIAIGIEIFLS